MSKSRSPRTAGDRGHYRAAPGPRRQLRQRPDHGLGHVGVEARGRLVNEEQHRVREQLRREVEALALVLRDVVARLAVPIADDLCRDLVEAQLRQNGIHPLRTFSTPQTHA